MINFVPGNLVRFAPNKNGLWPGGYDISGALAKVFGPDDVGMYIGPWKETIDYSRVIVGDQLMLVDNARIISF